MLYLLEIPEEAHQRPAMDQRKAGSRSQTPYQPLAIVILLVGAQSVGESRWSH